MGPITNVLGIDVSESAGDGTTMPWQQIAQRGTQIIVIVDTWMGQHVNKYAYSQISRALQHGLKNAAYVLAWFPQTVLLALHSQTT